MPPFYPFFSGFGVILKDGIIERRYGKDLGMFYELTLHAVKRLQQRGKSAEGVKMILRYGEVRKDDVRILRNKTAKREISRRRAWIERIKQTRPRALRLIKNLNRRIAALDKMRNCVLVCKNGKIITVYNKTRRLYRQRRGFHR